MRVTVDRKRCQGHARCVEICPALFRLDDDGYSTVADDDVATELEADAQRAVRNCPEGAISARK